MTSITALGVGSGLDLNGLLQKLKAGESKRLEPITQQKQSYQAKISAFGALKQALTSFQDAVATLADQATYHSVSSSVTGDALTASADSSTPTGDYLIHVTQRARASRVATVGVADKEASLGAGSIQYTLANGDTGTIDINADSSSLEDIRDAINASNSGLRASLIDDGSSQPYRLVLRASDTGSEASVSTITVSGNLAGTLQLDAATKQAGLDAQLSVNGINITSADNTVDGAIQGVTLNLTTSGDATLQITQDKSAITKAVKDFVDGYNSLVDTFGKLTDYNADTKQGGILIGNGTVRSIQSRLQSEVGSVMGGGSLRLLSDFGIDLQLDGTMKLDEDKLDAAVSQQADGLSQFFMGSTESKGMAEQLDDMLGRMTSDDGLIAQDTDGLKTSIDSLDDRYQEVQKRIDQVMAEYRREFTQLDSMVAKMNSTSTYLTQQFNAMASIGSSGK